MALSKEVKPKNLADMNEPVEEPALQSNADREIIRDKSASFLIKYFERRDDDKPPMIHPLPRDACGVGPRNRDGEFPNIKEFRLRNLASSGLPIEVIEGPAMCYGTHVGWTPTEGCDIRYGTISGSHTAMGLAHIQRSIGRRATRERSPSNA